MPLFILKSATTLDGKTATSSGQSQWITNEQSRAHVHQLRNHVDAIMVGSGTALRDNPQLTTRLPESGCVAKRDPLRVVVDSRLRISLDSKLVRHHSEAPTLIATLEAANDADGTNAEKLTQLQGCDGVEVVTLPANAEGRVDLNALAECLGARNIQSVLVEGGAELNSSMLSSGLIDRVMLYLAPKIIGGADGKGIFAGHGFAELSQALQLCDVRVQRFGDDLLVEGEVEQCLPA